MKFRTGIDIVEIKRIENLINEYGDKFLNRVYTEQEINYCNNKNVNKYESFAARFSAKEAVFKAISELLDNKFDMEWKNVEIVNNENGRPSVVLSEELLEKIGNANLQIDISLSHSNISAIASVVVLIEE
ncbi:MAG: holo-ACP synthase [Clostridia bacterium]|nr:holo-ACP synthase [Clostridia bacterium]